MQSLINFVSHVMLCSQEPGGKDPGSIKNSVCEGYVPESLVAKILAHVEHGHRGPGSIKNPVCEGYVPKNLVAKILTLSLIHI